MTIGAGGIRVYCTKLNHRNQYIVDCMLLTDAVQIVRFLVDTGAAYTCCSADSLNLFEEDFQKSPFRIMGGIIPNAGMKFYPYHVRQFTIGTVDLGERDIWVTFDDMATNDLLGLDILKDISLHQNQKTKEMCFYDVDKESFGSH